MHCPIQLFFLFSDISRTFSPTFSLILNNDNKWHFFVLKYSAITWLLTKHLLIICHWQSYTTYSIFCMNTLIDSKKKYFLIQTYPQINLYRRKPLTWKALAFFFISKVEMISKSSSLRSLIHVFYSSWIKQLYFLKLSYHLRI